MSDCDCHNRHNFFSGILFGALVGAGIVYFLTSTEEGKKIKEQIKKKGESALEDLKDLAADLEEKSEEFKEKAQEIEAQLEEKAGEVKEEGLGQIEKLREQGRQAVGKFFTRNGHPLS